VCLKSYLVEHGIHHRLICPYTHEQNKSIEGKHRHITDVGLTLAHAKIPIKYMGEAFTTVVNIINVLPSSVIKFDTPHHFGCRNARRIRRLTCQSYLESHLTTI